MNEADFKKSLGQKIKNYRNRLNLTQEMFSEKIGVTQRQISLIELGKSFPSPKTLLNIVSISNCSLKDLFDIDGFNNIKELKIELNKIINNLSDEKLKIIYQIAKNI